MITKTDTQNLLELIRSFYNLTGIKIAVYDRECNEILAYPAYNTTFCGMMDGKRCAESTRKLCQRCARGKGAMIEKCHAGLTEAVAPLSDGVSVIGYIMFGQITNRQDRTQFVQDTVASCGEYEVDAKRLEAALAEIRYYSDKQLNDAAKILNALARCIVYDKLVYPAEISAAQRIIDYIRQNLSKNLHVEELCRVFYLSKSEIYKITKPYMPRGIAVFVKEERLKKAAELLQSTNKPSWEIALETGFSDVNYFLRCFKSARGMSAAEYREGL